jgi:hypothetical protein
VPFERQSASIRPSEGLIPSPKRSRPSEKRPAVRPVALLAVNLLVPGGLARKMRGSGLYNLAACAAFAGCLLSGWMLYQNYLR